MFRREWSILVIFAAMILAFPAMSFAIDKADKDAILAELGNFMDKNPDILRNAIFQMADEYARQNKVDEAAALYEKGLKALPDNEDMMSRLANIYNQKKDYKKSAEIYKKLTALKPENTWYFNMLSDAYRNAGDKAGASAVWEELLKKSNKADVFMQAANFYSSENDMEKAMGAVKKALDLEPNNTGYLQTLEGFYMRAEKYTDAEAICNKVAAGAKDQWMKDWANAELINIYQKQNKLGALAENFEKALTQAPKDASAYKRLADLYQRDNKLDKAVAVYEKAITAGVDDRDLNNRLADLYEMTNSLDKAEAQIKKIIAGAPQDTYLYERLANVMARAGKKDEAKKVWADLLAKTPNDAGALSRYGDRLNEWGDSDAAIAQYRKAQSMDANNLWYSMRVVDILVNKSSFDAAKKELDGIIAKTKDDWMKQDAERRIKDIESRVKAAQAMAQPPALPATQVTAPAKPAETKAPAAPVAPAKTTKPVEKKKGLFSR